MFSANGVIVNLGGLMLTCAGIGDAASILGKPGSIATTVNFSSGTWNTSFCTDVGRAATTILNVTDGTLNNMANC